MSDINREAYQRRALGDDIERAAARRSSLSDIEREAGRTLDRLRFHPNPDGLAEAERRIGDLAWCRVSEYTNG
jgi:hypothetical protein